MKRDTKCRKWGGLGLSGHSRSPEIATIDRAHILLAFHNNYPYLVPFLRYSKILVDNRRFNIPHLYLTPPLGWPVWISPSFWKYDVVCVILCFVICVELRLVTDRQTDGRTDRQTYDDSICRASIASRGNDLACMRWWFPTEEPP